MSDGFATGLILGTAVEALLRWLHRWTTRRDGFCTTCSRSVP